MNSKDITALKFLYKHKGSGASVDDTFKPIRSVTSSLVKNAAKPNMKKVVKSGVEHAGERLGKKATGNSGDLIMKRIANMRDKKATV